MSAGTIGKKSLLHIRETSGMLRSLGKKNLGQEVRVPKKKPVRPLEEGDKFETDKNGRW